MTNEERDIITQFIARTSGADRYATEISKGVPTDAIVRSLVTTQNPVGFWNGRGDAAGDRPFETAWSIIMLRRGSLRNQ